MSEGRLESWALYSYRDAFAQRHWDNKVKAAKSRGQDLFALAWTPPGGRTFVYQVCCPSGDKQPELDQLVQLVKQNNKPWCNLVQPTRQLRSTCSAKADLGPMDGPGKHARADSASDVRMIDASPYKHEPAHGCFQLSEDVPEQLRLSQWSDYSMQHSSNQAELGPTELPDSINQGTGSTVASLPRFHHKYHSSSSSLGHANSWGGAGWGNSLHAQSFGGASGVTCSLASRGPTASPKQSCGGPKEASGEQQSVKAIITPQLSLIRPSDSSDVLALEESRRCWSLVRLGSKGGVVGEEEEESHTKEATGGKQKKRCNCRQRFVQVLKLLAGGCIFGGRCM